MLWNRSTFATLYHPADLTNLQLYYSDERKDPLVQYDETRKREKKVRRRCFWLEPNLMVINPGRKPQFVDPVRFGELTAIPIAAAKPDSPLPGFKGLYAVLQRIELRFAL